LPSRIKLWVQKSMPSASIGGTSSARISNYSQYLSDVPHCSAVPGVQNFGLLRPSLPPLCQKRCTDSSETLISEALRPSQESESEPLSLERAWPLQLAGKLASLGGSEL
jgi:hypothetical protein